MKIPIQKQLFQYSSGKLPGSRQIHADDITVEIYQWVLRIEHEGRSRYGIYGCSLSCSSSTESRKGEESCYNYNIKC